LVLRRGARGNTVTLKRVVLEGTDQKKRYIGKILAVIQIPFKKGNILTKFPRGNAVGGIEEKGCTSG